MFESVKKHLRSLGFHEESMLFKALWGAKVRLMNPVLHSRIGWQARKEAQSGNWLTLRDPRAILSHIVGQGADLNLTGETVAAPQNSTEWMRAVLGPLITDPKLFDAHPRALRDGVEGSYFTWLSEGEPPARLSRHAWKDGLRKTFQSKPGDIARRFLDVNPWHLERAPLGMMAPSLKTSLAFIIRTAHLDMQVVSPEEALWFAVETLEDHPTSLAETWLRLPAWQQRWPKARTIAGWKSFTLELSRDYKQLDCSVLGVSPAWPEGGISAAEKILGPLDGPSWGADQGINLFTYWNCICGLREAAAQLGRSAARHGCPVSLRDVPNSMSDVLHNRQETLGLEEHALSVFVVPPLWEPAELFRRAGLPIRKNVKRVGVWFWELEDVPKAWIKNSKFFDEIWAPSRFIGESLRKVLPVPVIDMPQSLRVQPFEPVPREMYGLKPGETVFLFVFDAASSVDRKNPAGLVRAFQQAFPRTREARLVIKVSRPQAEPRNMAKLRQMVAGDPRILLVERTMSRHELLGLMDAADCYVSLHRAEGLGLTMAEAALLAKPVITTAYSGVLDFLNDKTALMVGHSMTTITHDRPPFQKGWRWADPDLVEAANHMRWVRAQPLLARQIGLRAKESVAKALDPAKQGQWIADQLHRLIPGFRKYAA